MLIELAVKNLAIIKDIRLKFTKGFNVITGETGAGKSIILEAISMLYGKRANTEIIRTGEELCYIEGVFATKSLSDDVLNYIRNNGIIVDDLLVVRRLIYKDKPSRVYLNDTLVTLGFLSALGENIISLLSQHEHQKLFDTSVQLELLDRFLGFTELTIKVKTLYAEYKTLEKTYQDLILKSEDIIKEREYIEYQIKEVEELDPSLGEEDNLAEIIERAKNSKTVLGILNTLENTVINGDHSLNNKILNIISSLVNVETNEYLEELKTHLDDILLLTDKIHEVIPFLLRDYEINPEQLNDADYRLSEIRRLEKKFNCFGTEGILAEFDKMKNEYKNLQEMSSSIVEIKLKYKKKETEYLEQAKLLSKKRKENKEKFSNAIITVLKTLGMKNLNFYVDITESSPNQRGLDKILFMFSGNLGEDLKPISKVASGGELSRVMLAIQSVTNKLYDYGIEVYDEIDAGIGGDIAFSVGALLKQIATEHQVLVISHLAQIADSADNHIFISKRSFDGRTEVTAKNLSKEEQKVEISRMMGFKGTLLEKENFNIGRV